MPRTERGTQAGQEREIAGACGSPKRRFLGSGGPDPHQVRPRHTPMAAHRQYRQPSASGGLDPDRLHVEVFLDVLLATLASVAAHLVAAERHRRVHRLVAVDPDGTRANAARELVRLGHVARPKPTAETE